MTQATIGQAMQLAVQNHRAGKLAEAEKIYRQVLTQQPNQPDALHLLGVLVHQAGRLDTAIELIQRAIAINPGVADYHNNLGYPLWEKGLLDEAVVSLRQAIRLKPDLVEAHNNLGNVLRDQGRFDDAIVACRQAIRLKPDFAKAHNNLGNALRDKGAVDEAVAAYQQALRLKPDWAEVHNNLSHVLRDQGRLDDAIAALRQAVRHKPDFAEAHNNLGNALRANGQPDEAIDAYRNLLRLKPDLVEAYNNLGIILRDRGRLDEAIDAYRHALRLKPDYAEAHNNLGVVLRDQGRLDEAIDAYRHALRLKPDYAEAHNNLGVALYFKGQFDESIDAYRHALRLKPDYAEAHLNLSLTLLLKGNFVQGWPEYEWRWRCKGFPSLRHELVQPRWDGSPLNGRTILLHAEQGFGDAIQFVRYAPLVAGREGRVIIGCSLELARLFRSNPVLGQIVSGDKSLPQFDFHCPLASLPFVFATNMESIPASVPYLNADPALVEMWQRKLASSQGKLRVGLSWAGNPAFRGDRNRSLPFERLAPLGGVPGITFFSLQKGAASGQAKNPPPGMELIDLGPELTDFADTAAVMSLMDLIITIDTSVPHLAGALARPVWLLLPFVPEWRWLLNRDDSPWYPTMRLFRQKSPGDWPEMIQRVAQALREFRPERWKP